MCFCLQLIFFFIRYKTYMIMWKYTFYAYVQYVFNTIPCIRFNPDILYWKYFWLEIFWLVTIVLMYLNVTWTENVPEMRRQCNNTVLQFGEMCCTSNIQRRRSNGMQNTKIPRRCNDTTWCSDTHVYISTNVYAAENVGITGFRHRREKRVV